MSYWSNEPGGYLKVLVEQNPWQSTGSVPLALAPKVERPFAQDLWRRVLKDDPRRFQLILGPRRVGKTTAMYQTVRHLLTEGIPAHRLWWLRLDHPLLLTIPLGTLVEEIVRQSEATSESPAFVFLDEVVYGKEWDLWLKTFYDDHWPVRVVATSSATAALADRRLESGVGRWEEQYLSPYLLTEYLDLINEPVDVVVRSSLWETLTTATPNRQELTKVVPIRRRFILTGGFPELLTLSGNEQDDSSILLSSQQILRSDSVERAIYKDIPQSFKVENPLLLERLLYVLAGQISGVLSPTNISQILDGMAQPTFDKYLSYLEKAFLVFTLPNYSGQESSIQRRGRKLYFVDGAVRNAALQRGIGPLTDAAEMGLLLENLIAAHMHVLAKEEGTRLFHWRDSKAEVDLVFDSPVRPMAFEIGSSNGHKRTGLKALMQKHSKFAGGCFVVAPDSPLVLPERTGDGIGSVPFDLLLLALGRQAQHIMRDRLVPQRNTGSQ